MNTTTYKKATESQYPFMKFISEWSQHNLKENEYFALMVEDSSYPANKNPHVIGIEQTYHVALVGIEGTSKPQRPYISKEYSKRMSLHRGTTVVVEVQPENLDKCCILD